MATGDETGTDISNALQAEFGFSNSDKVQVETSWRIIAEQIITNRAVSSIPSSSNSPGEPGQIIYDNVNQLVYLHTGSGWVRFAALAF